MHISRFNEAGDYFKLDIAGFPIILIMGKDDKVEALHNVCRHRAYPVVNKPSGSSLVIGMYLMPHCKTLLTDISGCRYHGWSYNTKGDLIKAPGFEDVPSFDRSANGLFKIETYTTRQGLIFVNFDTSDSVVPFAEFYRGLEDEMDDFDFAGFEYVESWEQDGEFNWKTLSGLMFPYVP